MVMSLVTRAEEDLCSCGETQTMSHIVESCHLTKLNGGLSQIHSADDAADLDLTHIRKKKKTAVAGYGS